MEMTVFIFYREKMMKMCERVPVNMTLRTLTNKRKEKNQLKTLTLSANCVQQNCKIFYREWASEREAVYAFFVSFVCRFAD